MRESTQVRRPRFPAGHVSCSVRRLTRLDYDARALWQGHAIEGFEPDISKGNIMTNGASFVGPLEMSAERSEARQTMTPAKRSRAMPVSQVQAELR
jgi:hypothetical protein